MATDDLISALLDGDGVATRLKAIDKIEGLEEDLKSAVTIAWKYGAKDWVRANYPRLAVTLNHREPSHGRP